VLGPVLLYFSVLVPRTRSCTLRFALLLCFLLLLMSHSWEDPCRRWAFQQPGSESEGSDEEVEKEPTPEEAADLLVEFLLLELYNNRLSAKALCTVCHWASKAGAVGAVAKFALAPDSQSGKFQRKIDDATGVCMAEKKAACTRLTFPCIASAMPSDLCTPW